MAYIIGVDDVSKEVKDIAVGVDGVAHAVKSAYIGVDGVARKFYQRGYYEKRVYFFGYTGTLGDYYLADKIYSVKTDGSDPIEYTLETPILAFYTGTDSSLYFPSYATWKNIKPAKMFYDPKTKRLCVVGFSDITQSTSGRVHFYTIDCTKNVIIDHVYANVGYTTTIDSPNYDIYYSYETGQICFCKGALSAYFVCYNIRTTTLKTATYTPSSGYIQVRGLFATQQSANVMRFTCIYANESFAYRGIQCGVFDFDLDNLTVSEVAQTVNIPVGAHGVSFIKPHPFINKNTFNGVNGICFLGTDYDSTTGAYKTSTGYVITKDGYKSNSFTIPSSFVADREFGFSNTHGQMWVQDTNGARLGKYGNNYTETNNPTGAMANNSGKTYDGPVIGGGVITGYTSANAAVVYVNISGSYYNITPTIFGPYNNAICEGVNLKEILIPGNDRFLVYDFNQAAYTTPISVSNTGVKPVPYTAVLTWTAEEQDTLVNLGY